CVDTFIGAFQRLSAAASPDVPELTPEPASIAELRGLLSKQRAESDATTQSLLAGLPEALTRLSAEELDAQSRDTAASIAKLEEAVAILSADSQTGLPAPDEAALPAQKREREEQATALAARIRQIEADYIRRKGEFDTLTTELSASLTHQADLEKRFREAKERFRAALEPSGFPSYGEYAAYKARTGEAEQLRHTVTAYDRQLAQLQTQTDLLAGEVKDAQRADIPAMEARLETLTKQLAAFREAHRELHTQIAMSGRQLELLEALHRESGELGERYAAFQELSQLARGTRSPHISFERYILAAYFEDILQVANIHLRRMTNLRYSLKRREEASRGTSGLDMDVVDMHTGTRRSVSTLSGGEGFKASLALALGLSDVVQMHAGAVSIDTMFIDEGFGSLDEKSLDSVVETLISLQSIGRTVGIISHVQSLNMHIPAKLEVSREGTGSTAKFVIH
ncbi:hypothetical protein LJC63_11670, partial [Ruminococcaceae bacterium OttesenSCG-928-L11]|nr:hypothetical protein [Ruminococcaceae bacterium OttesenSCG-928-L11]